jgi:transcriptional regulator with XRE-family HTH domain
MSSPTQRPKMIRELREERGWAQLDLALRLHADRATISKWELGVKRPSVGNRQRLARLFGVEVTEIAFGRDEQS